MLKKKINLILAFVFTLVLAINSVFAVEIYDAKVTENVYKLSEDDSSFSFPVFRVSGQRMELDKSIEQIGLYMTNSTIDISSEQKGIQMFYNNDTVRINSSMEYAVVFSTGSVVLNADIEKTILVYCNGTFTIGENANVNGNIIAYTPSLVVDGVVEGNILGSVNTLTINNTVNGKIKMDVYDVVLGQNAKIAQEIELNTTNTELKIDENVAASKIDVIQVPKESFGDKVVNILKIAITSLATYFILVIFAKKDRLKLVMGKLENEKVLKNGIWGYVGTLMIFSLGIILLMLLTDLGVAGIIFAIAVLLIFTLIKNVIAGAFIVELVNKRYQEQEIKPNSILVAIATFLMITILENIPIIGTIVSFIIFIISLGIVISLIKPNNKKEEVVEQEVIETK